MAADRKRLGLDEPAAIVGFFGQVIEVKGIEEFLNAAVEIRRHRPAARFLIVGDDQQAGENYRVAMEEKAKLLGLGPACVFLGFRSDIWMLMHLCSVIVMPSREEPFGNVAVEAAAAGRPVVATRAGGIPEIVEHGTTGVLVPIGDFSAIARAVLLLLHNEPRRHVMGEAARRRAASCFSMRSQAQRLRALYDETLRDQGSAGRYRNG